MKKKLLLIGGGGHCKSCIDVVESTADWEVFGIIDLPEKIGEKICGYSIVGSDDDIERFKNQVDGALITVGHIKSNAVRLKIFSQLKKLGFSLPVIISSNAHVSKHASIDEGTIIMHQVIVNAGAKIGANCIINSKALVEHDARVGDHCHISTAAVLNGDVTVGNNCFIGSTSTINHGVTICDDSIIASKTLIRKNIRKSGMFFQSNPLKHSYYE